MPYPTNKHEISQWFKSQIEDITAGTIKEQDIIVEIGTARKPDMVYVFMDVEGPHKDFAELKDATINIVDEFNSDPNLEILNWSDATSGGKKFLVIETRYKPLG